jgi:hypothetical protein
MKPEPNVNRPIRWVEVETPLVHLGHGVEFGYDDIRGTIAFVDGFTWLHEPGSAVTATITSLRPEMVTVEAWASIVQETREALERYMRSAVLQELQTQDGRVRVVVNG